MGGRKLAQVKLSCARQGERSEANQISFIKTQCIHADSQDIRWKRNVNTLQSHRFGKRVESDAQKPTLTSSSEPAPFGC